MSNTEVTTNLEETLADAEKRAMPLENNASEGKSEGKSDAKESKGTKPSGKPLTDLPENFVIQGIDTKEKGALADHRNEKPLKEENLKSYELNGIMTPVIVRIVDGKKEIVEGRQRIRGAREINRRRRIDGDKLPQIKVPYIVREGNDKNAVLNSLVLNAYRDGDEPWEMAERLCELSRLGYSTAELAQATRQTEENVRVMLRYEKLEPEIQADVRAGKLKYSAVMQWAGMSGAKQKEARAASLATNGKVTAAVAKSVADAVKRKADAEEAEAAAAEPTKGSATETPKEGKSGGKGSTKKTQVKPGKSSATTTASKGIANKPAQEQMITKPGGVLLRHLIEGWNKDEIPAGLDRLVILAFQFVRGEITAREVPGLTKAIRAMDKVNNTEHAKELGLDESKDK